MSDIDKSIIVYLLKSRPDEICCFQPNAEDIIESTIIDKNMFRIENEKISEILKRCKNNQTKAREFCRYCQKTFMPNFSFPFDINSGIVKYLVGDYKTTGKLPTINELKDFNIISHWKLTEHIWHQDKELFPYETLASEWLLERNIIRCDPCLPDEVKHSLDCSSICKLSHCFANAFKSYLNSSENIIKFTEQWVKDHENELLIKDINNMTPLELFNTINSDDYVYGGDEQQKYLVQRMRETLTPSTDEQEESNDLTIELSDDEINS